MSYELFLARGLRPHEAVRAARFLVESGFDELRHPRDRLGKWRRGMHATLAYGYGFGQRVRIVDVGSDGTLLVTNPRYGLGGESPHLRVQPSQVRADGTALSKR